MAQMAVKGPEVEMLVTLLALSHSTVVDVESN